MQLNRSFTLIEILIVVFIISISYALVFSKIGLLIKDSISLVDIKKNLTSYNYKNTISLISLSNSHKCIIYKDGQFFKELKSSLFKEEPEVYKISSNSQIVQKELGVIKINDFIYDIEFEYLIKSDNLEELIVKYQDKVYMYDSISDKATIFTSLSEVEEYIETKKNLLKEAQSGF